MWGHEIAAEGIQTLAAAAAANSRPDAAAGHMPSLKPPRNRELADPSPALLDEFSCENFRVLGF